MQFMFEADMGSLAATGVGDMGLAMGDSRLLQVFCCFKSECESFSPASGASAVRLVDAAVEASPAHVAGADELLPRVLVAGWTVVTDAPSLAHLYTVAADVAELLDEAGLSPEVEDAVGGDKMLGWPAWVSYRGA